MLLQEALELAEKVESIGRKISDANQAGQLESRTLAKQIEECEKRGILTEVEARKIREFDSKVTSLLAVDDFSPIELAGSPVSTTKKKTQKRKRTVKKKLSKKPKTVAKKAK